MEKGPQDALTLEARYSLSEEKLLRATFEYKELMVFVSASDSVYSSTQDIPVRVLDCDTITQVKEKCLDAKYRGYRFADRPAPGDMELEWKTGMNGKMALQVSALFCVTREIFYIQEFDAYSVCNIDFLEKFNCNFKQARKYATHFLKIFFF